MREVTQGEPSSTRIKITIDVLEKFEFEDISRAISKGIHLWKFFPAPCEILELAFTSVELELFKLEENQKLAIKPRKEIE